MVHCGPIEYPYNVISVSGWKTRPYVLENHLIYIRPQILMFRTCPKEMDQRAFCRFTQVTNRRNRIKKLDLEWCIMHLLEQN